MTEATYEAWDGKIYEWPPPQGWYEASDRRWWPEGYGPQPETETADTGADADTAASHDSDGSDERHDDEAWAEPSMTTGNGFESEVSGAVAGFETGAGSSAEADLSGNGRPVVAGEADDARGGASVDATPGGDLGESRPLDGGGYGDDLHRTHSRDGEGSGGDDAGNGSRWEEPMSYASSPGSAYSDSAYSDSSYSGTSASAYDPSPVSSYTGYSPAPQGEAGSSPPGSSPDWSPPVADGADEVEPPPAESDESESDDIDADVWSAAAGVISTADHQPMTAWVAESAEAAAGEQLPEPATKDPWSSHADGTTDRDIDTGTGEVAGAGEDRNGRAGGTAVAGATAGPSDLAASTSETGTDLFSRLQAEAAARVRDTAGEPPDLLAGTGDRVIGATTGDTFDRVVGDTAVPAAGDTADDTFDGVSGDSSAPVVDDTADETAGGMTGQVPPDAPSREFDSSPVAETPTFGDALPDVDSVGLDGEPTAEQPVVESSPRSDFTSGFGATRPGFTNSVYDEPVTDVGDGVADPTEPGLDQEVGSGFHPGSQRGFDAEHESTRHPDFGLDPTGLDAAPTDGPVDGTVYGSTGYADPDPPDHEPGPFAAGFSESQARDTNAFDPPSFAPAATETQVADAPGYPPAVPDTQVYNEHGSDPQAYTDPGFGADYQSPAGQESPSNLAFDQPASSPGGPVAPLDAPGPRPGTGRRVIYILLGVLALAAAGVAGYLAYQFQDDSDDGGESGQGAAVDGADGGQPVDGSLANPHSPGSGIRIEYPDGAETQPWTLEVQSLDADGNGGEVRVSMQIINEDVEGLGQLSDLRIALVDAEGNDVAPETAPCLAGDSLALGQEIEAGQSVAGPVCWSVGAAVPEGTLLAVESTKAQGRIFIQLP